MNEVTIDFRTVDFEEWIVAKVLLPGDFPPGVILNFRNSTSYMVCKLLDKDGYFLDMETGLLRLKLHYNHLDDYYQISNASINIKSGEVK